MNEEYLFQKADYTQNPNLILEENTLYEIDPKCMIMNSRRGQNMMRQARYSAQVEKMETPEEEETAQEEQELCQKVVLVEQAGSCGKKNTGNGIVMLLLFWYFLCR